MKITLERLREIITEEVIKEELALDIAAPAIAAMLQGTDSVDTSEIFGAVFDQMYGEGALEGEAERMASAEEEPEEDFPTDYQPGGGEGDRPVMGFKENINEIIRQEYYIYMIENHQRLLKEGPYISPQAIAQSAATMDRQRRRRAARARADRNIKLRDAGFNPESSHDTQRMFGRGSRTPYTHPETGEPMPAKEWGELILSMGRPEDPKDTEAFANWTTALAQEKKGFPPHFTEFQTAAQPANVNIHPWKQIKMWNKVNLGELVELWDSFIAHGGDIRTAVKNTKIDGKMITDALAALYKKLTADANIQQHAQ